MKSWHGIVEMCITIDWGKVQQNLKGFEFSNKWVYSRLILQK